MADTLGRTVMRRIVEQMRADPHTLEGAVDAARAKSPEVAALPRHEVQRHIARLLAAVSSAFIDSSGLRSDDMHGVDLLAEDRAMQGIPLEALLEGFQAGRLYVLRRLVERATAQNLPADHLMDALIELDAYTNEMQNRLVLTYRETELGQVGTAQAARLEALRVLLRDGPAACVDDTGLDPGRRHHCLISGLSDPRQARRVAATLTASGGLAGMVDGYLCAVTPRLPDRTAVNGMLVIASPAVRPDRLPVVYELCRAALESARRRSLQGLRPLTGLAMAIVADAHPRLADLLAEDLLYGLDPTDEFHRLMAQTALIYFTHGGRADLTAAALHVHPNTVKHRLRRLSELTGLDDPRRPEDTLHHALRWCWALNTWLGHHGPPKESAERQEHCDQSSSSTPWRRAAATWMSW